MADERKTAAIAETIPRIRSPFRNLDVSHVRTGLADSDRRPGRTARWRPWRVLAGAHGPSNHGGRSPRARGFSAKPLLCRSRIFSELARAFDASRGAEAHRGGID